MKLVITRGLPASGKTTWAREWVAADPEKRARVNRDDLRSNLFGRPSPLPYQLEEAVSAAQREAVRGLLEAGHDVVVDDTHLRERYIRAWRELAADCGAEFELQDWFLNVPVEECILRDNRRLEDGAGHVGETVIRDMAARFKNALKERSPDAEPGGYRYVPDTSKPRAWVVDIDGTLAHHNGRSPYDYTLVGQDAPDAHVIALVNALASDGNRIVVVSGREDSCRDATEGWLLEHVGYAWTQCWKRGVEKGVLLMRATGDRRNDATAKLDIFREHIAPNWYVQGVLDDRNRVVRMWRRIGLLCCQVAPGAF